MIKQILVPTDGSEYATVGVAYSVALAKQHRASLVGLYVVDVKLLEGPFLRDISASLGTAPYVNYQNNIGLILEERGKAALETLQERCRKAGVPVETHLDTGSVSPTIIEYGERVDLIVMGRGGEHGEWLDGLLGSTTERVVRRSACPVLVTGRSDARISRFLVAFDGSAHARKALHFATNLGETWLVPFEVLVVSANGEAIMDEAKRYLEAHDLSVDYSIRDGDPREVILSHAEEREADLLVMGAYGHSKVHELLLGCTTQHVLNHAKCPVLLTR